MIFHVLKSGAYETSTEPGPGWFLIWWGMYTAKEVVMITYSGKITVERCYIRPEEK
jgi:hypothetical protein